MKDKSCPYKVQIGLERRAIRLKLFIVTTATSRSLFGLWRMFQNYRSLSLNYGVAREVSRCHRPHFDH